MGGGTTERYEFTWVGKNASRVEANTTTNKTLRPCIEESKDWDNTENLYIEGDNLEVLKLLQNSYFNKVKMIYIDPPYNTGNDFIYIDDFAQNIDEYEEAKGSFDEEGNRLFKNTDTNGRFHSDWCSMIYPRLVLARNLLADDGVIFISIDDNEQENLKKICDEVFGENNFIGVYLKQSKIGGGSDSKFIVKEHEYCLVFSKNINKTSEMFIKHDMDYLKRYKERDEYGSFFWDTFARPGLKNPIYYDIVAPDGSIINNGWIHSEERFKQELKENKVRIIPKVNGGWSVQFKQYLNPNGKKPRSMTMDFGGSNEGKINIEILFKNSKLFSYPKSVKYILSLISTINNKDCIVLDFFSGSATTAHAVMQLNAEDGGKRKFIMVQLPEKTDEKSEAFKAGYKNICEIGKERIRRAGEKIKEEAGLNGQDLDIGFRVLKLDSSNMKDIYYSADEYDQGMLENMQSNTKEDRTDLDLLFGCLVDWGLELNKPYTTKVINDHKVHIYNDGDLVACFEKDLDMKTIDEIAKLQALRVVFSDNSFVDSATKINVAEHFKMIAPDTDIKVI